MTHLIHQGRALDILCDLESDSFDAVIADPPYFKVASENWDYQWTTIDEYIEWCQKWFEEVWRILKPMGHFWLFGYFESQAESYQRLKNTGFKQRQFITIDKGMKSVAGRATKHYKMFPNVTEYLSNYVCYTWPEVKKMLREKQNEKGYTNQEMNEAIGTATEGGGMWSIYTGPNVCEQVPTEDKWESICDKLDLSIPYEHVSMTWNSNMGVSNVWSDLDFQNNSGLHPTEKPLRCIDRIVTSSTNPGDHVLDLFAGSLSVMRSCIENGRTTESVELSKDYIEKTLHETRVEVSRRENVYEVTPVDNKTDVGYRSDQIEDEFVWPWNEDF